MFSIQMLYLTMHYHVSHVMALYTFKFQWFKCIACTINLLKNIWFTEKCVSYSNEITRNYLIPFFLYCYHILFAVKIQSSLPSLCIWTLRRHLTCVESVLLPKYGNCLFIYICRFACTICRAVRINWKSFLNTWNFPETMKWCQSYSLLVW